MLGSQYQKATAQCGTCTLSESFFLKSPEPRKETLVIHRLSSFCALFNFFHANKGKDAEDTFWITSASSRNSACPLLEQFACAPILCNRTSPLANLFVASFLSSHLSKIHLSIKNLVTQRRISCNWKWCSPPVWSLQPAYQWPSASPWWPVSIKPAPPCMLASRPRMSCSAEFHLQSQPSSTICTSLQIIIGLLWLADFHQTQRKMIQIAKVNTIFWRRGSSVLIPQSVISRSSQLWAHKA